MIKNYTSRFYDYLNEINLTSMILILLLLSPVIYKQNKKYKFKKYYFKTRGDKKILNLDAWG